MSRISVFSAPFLLGFDSFEERFDRLSKTADGYPPYNIERVLEDDGTERFLVSVAVAGFARDELEVIAEDQQMVVRGKQKDEPARDYLHRGIAARQFQRAFILADGMIVRDATLGHGMIVVAIERPKTTRIARAIDIRSV